MRKSISIVTGATGGLGKVFVKYLLEEVDEIWAIARNTDKLNQLREEYSRALNVELDGTGIVATVACPGWIKTNLLESERNGKQIRFPAIALPEEVVLKILKDAKRGKDMSVYSTYVKFQHLLTKIFPHKLVMKSWLKQIKEYI